MFQTVHAMALPKQRPKEPERRYHHGDLRRALVDAALALIAEGELGTFSLREVARRAGVTTRTVLIWSIGHGLASLWNDGVLDDKLDLGSDRAFLDATVEQIATFDSGVPVSAKAPPRKSRRH